MKKILPLATLSSLALLSSTAMAQVSVHDHRGDTSCGDDSIPAVTSYGPAYGPSGTYVTVRGHHFIDGMKIRYGQTLIVPSRLTASEIEFAIPRNGDDGSIAVIMPRTREQLSVGAFDVRDVVDDRHDDWRDRQERAERLRLRRERQFLASTAVQAELELHSKRLARLNRTLYVIRARRHNQRQIYRLELSIAKENERHTAQMALLRDAFAKKYRKDGRNNDRKIYSAQWSAKITASL